MSPVTIAIITRDRVDDLIRTLARLASLPTTPPVIVVDNASSDGSADAVRARFPQVRTIRLERNSGVAGRNLAAVHATTPYVAFNDDDSWWTEGSLERAASLFDRHASLGAIAAHVLVGPQGIDDPTTRLMRDSSVAGDAAIEGVPVLGFLACALVVRRQAFLEVGGFEPRLHFGGEEQLLAADLAAAGWHIRYVPDLLVHHHPSLTRDSRLRHRRHLRNALWFYWLRRPAGVALRRSWSLVREAPLTVSAPGLLEAVMYGGWVARARHTVPRWLEVELQRLEQTGRSASEPF